MVHLLPAGRIVRPTEAAMNGFPVFPGRTLGLRQDLSAWRQSKQRRQRWMWYFSIGTIDALTSPLLSPTLPPVSKDISSHDQLKLLFSITIAEEQSRSPLGKPAQVPVGFDWPSLLAQKQRSDRGALPQLARDRRQAGKLAHRTQEGATSASLCHALNAPAANWG